MDGGLRSEIATSPERDECAVRVVIVQQLLGELEFSAQPHTGHLWLKLLLSWSIAAFVTAAREQGVALAPTDAFAVQPLLAAARNGGGVAPLVTT